MTADLVKYAVDGRIGIVTINRPDKLNAISLELKHTLIERLLAADADAATSVVVLRAEGRAFSAGYDISPNPARAARRGNALAWHESLTDDIRLEMTPWDMRKPVIASVQGHCLGGGCELMMLCDLAIAADDAMFGEPEIRFGSGVVTMVMPWLVGARAAKELLLTGEDRVDAQEAKRIGLVNRVVPRDDLEPATLALANEIAILDPVAIAMTKRSINRSLEVAGFREALAANVDIDTVIETAEVPERKEFSRIREEQGLKVAIAWRDARFRGV
jgi:enoyl-CoA hydratase